MEIVLIRGKQNAGKSTTASLTYLEILKVAQKEHIFNGEHVDKNSLKFEDGKLQDFEAILTVNGKIIVIISAGDEPDKLMARIAAIILYVQQEMKVQIDILICCGRSVNKSGSVYMRLKDMYKSSKLTEEWPGWTDNKHEIDLIKKKSAEKIMKLI